MRILKNKGKLILLGNEAIIRGALESGVKFVSTYPGTPASEIGNTMSYIAQKAGVYFEFSTNEKVAMEAAAGASFSGLRSLVAMKNFGLNVASDFLLPLVYSGIKGGMVIVVADDPGCSSSAQSEQDSRALSLSANIPTLTPATPQECKDFTKFAFEISEKYKIPVMLQTTTRVALQSGIVSLNKIARPRKKAKFIKEPHRFVTMPPRVLEMKKEVLEKIKKIQNEYSEKSLLNKVSGGCHSSPNSKEKEVSKSSEIGIITSGVSYLYAKESLKELKLDLPVLKLAFFNPLPEEKIKRFINPPAGGLKKVLVIEELEPYLEREVERFAREVNPKLQIFGKNLLPWVGEFKPEYVTGAVAKVAEKKWGVSQPKLPVFPKRFPQLCPGCPYWFVFQGIKKAVNEREVIFGGEIGCYMLAGLPPHHLQDYLYCMGSSIGIAHGIKKTTNQKLITFVGDSSFFHAGIPALINTVYNKSNPLIIIMDNKSTAMTGHQPHPGVGKTGMGEKTTAIKIEALVRACGVRNLKIIDPINQKDFIKTVKEFLEKKEVSVIIARRPCIFVK